MNFTDIILTILKENVLEDAEALIHKITNSDAFKEWFRNSEMVDGDGNPIVFYHGSRNQFDVFDKSKISTATDAGWLGEGFYFYTDYHEASNYGEVSLYFLNITNVYHSSDEDNINLANLNDITASKQFSENLKQEGYDGVFYNGNLRGETVVFEPNQIWKIM